MKNKSRKGISLKWRVFAGFAGFALIMLLILWLLQTFFLDASAYAGPSSTDQEHLTEEGHRLLAEAVLQKIREIEAQIAA